MWNTIYETYLVQSNLMDAHNCGSNSIKCKKTVMAAMCYVVANKFNIFKTIYNVIFY